MLNFPQQRDGLQPAKTFFDSLSLDLADAITLVPSRTPINGASASSFVVLRYMRRDSHVPAFGHEIDRVVAFVPARRHGLCTRNLLQHQQRRVAFRCAVSLEYFAFHDQPVAILHQQIPL